MKKRLVFIIIGIIILMVAFILIFIDYRDKHNNRDEYKVNTSNIVGKKIDNSKYDTLSYDDEEFKFDYVKSHDLETRNKIIFPILKNINFYSANNSEYLKEFILDDLNIIVKVLPSNSINDYIDELTTNYENSKFEYFNYSVIDKIVTIDNIELKYIKFQYMNRKDSDYNEDFYIVINSSNNEIISVRYSIINKKFSDAFLSKIINNLKIENNSAQYLISKNENGKLTGTIKQYKPNVKDKEYSVTYKVASNKYKEIETSNNTTNITTFSSLKEPNNIVTVEIKTTYYYDTGIIQAIKDEYTENENTKITRTENINYQNKKYIKLTLETIKDDKKVNTYAYLHQIDYSAAYVITVSFINSDQVFFDFTDFVIE